MTVDLSLSVELRMWVQRHLRFDGAAYVFADGTTFENLRAAVQSAWLADQHDLAYRLAKQYDVTSVMCVRCTRRMITDISHCIVPTTSVAARLGAAPHVWPCLCEHCQLDLIGVP